MRVLLYLRVSSEGQARKENPIATQKAACLEYAHGLGYEVDESRDIYADEGISGRSTQNRFAFKEMEDRLRKDSEIAGVVAYDISRISRDLMTYLQFKKELRKCSKKFFSVSEPLSNDDAPSARMLEQLLASFAEFRSGQDGEKIKEAMHRKGESGIYPGKAPYGYKNVRGDCYGGKEKRWMEVDPITSVYVKEMFERYATGRWSLKQLADDLNSREVPSPNRREWCTSSIEKILKKKTYIGFIDWGGLNNPNGQHEKLVDDKLFNKVQMLLKTRNYGADKGRKHTFILRGIAYCGECGSRINGSYHKKQNGKTYAYYGCQKRANSKPVCCSQSVVPMKEMERQLQKLIKSIQIPESTAKRINKKIREVVGEDNLLNEKAQKSIRLQLETIKNRRKILLEKCVDGIIDDQTYKNYESDLDRQEASLRGQLIKIDTSTADVLSRAEKAVNLAQNCYQTYKNASYEQKIMLVQTLFSRIIVRDKKIEKAFLNHPFLFVCHTKIRGLQEFQYKGNGGDGEN